MPTKEIFTTFGIILGMIFIFAISLYSLKSLSHPVKVEYEHYDHNLDKIYE